MARMNWKKEAYNWEMACWKARSDLNKIDEGYTYSEPETFEELWESKSSEMYNYDRKSIKKITWLHKHKQVIFKDSVFRSKFC